MNSSEEERFFTLMQLRRRAGLTQKQLATALEQAFGRSVTVQTVSAWERKVHAPRLTPDETLKVCNILHCSLEELATATQKSLSPSCP